MRISRFVALALLLCVALSSCHQREQRYTLMSGIVDLSFADYFNGSKTIEGSWKPTRFDIGSLESHLAEMSNLKSERGIIGASIAHPDRYYRQYFAAITKGQKQIFINAFLITPPPSDWHEKLVVIGDGGLTMWKVLYDPETKKFSNLETNGIG